MMKNSPRRLSIATVRSVLSNRSSLLGFAALAVLAVTLALLAGKLSAQPINIAGTGHHQHTQTQANGQMQMQMDGQSPATVTSGTTVGTQDPASKKQVSLSEAASGHNGNGQQVDKPASGVVGIHQHVDPLSVLPDTQNTGVLSSGCVAGYGKPGSQCLPVRGPGDKPMTCADVRTQFPDGIEVTGNDQLHLDTNKNKIACDSGD